MAIPSFTKEPALIMDIEGTNEQKMEARSLQTYAPRFVSFDTPVSTGELGPPRRNEGDELRTKITQKDLHGGGLIANVSRVCYGTHIGQKAALIVITLILRGCPDRMRLRQLEVLITFENQNKLSASNTSDLSTPIVRNLAPRKIRGTLDEAAGTWSLQVEQQCYLARSSSMDRPEKPKHSSTTTQSASSLTITGQPWSQSRDKHTNQAGWIIREKSKQVIGIPDEISLAAVVEYDQSFQADITVTLGLPWLQQLLAFPWSKHKDDPVLFPAHSLGPYLGDMPSTSKFEAISEDEWATILSSHNIAEKKVEKQKPLSKISPRSFRLRGIPSARSDDVLNLIKITFGKGRVFDFALYSLTEDLSRTGEMTAVFSSTDLSKIIGVGDRWDYSPDYSPRDAASILPSEVNLQLVLDTHFEGLTLLASPKFSDHLCDIIAIPGMAGHAYGSFKERGGEHMWLLHDVPRCFPNARVFIYGYNTRLPDSRSTESFEDIASTLRTAIITARSNDKSNDLNSKPMILIAHSLGGILVKQVLIQMMDEDSEDKRDKANAQAVHGVLFFGVPSQGIDITSTRAMVHDQPNEALLLSIRPDSDTLRRLHWEFGKKFTSRTCKIVSFFETELSPTAVKGPRGWEMNGEPALLVGANSATTGSRWWEIGADYSAPIGRSHSELVKFHPRDRWYDEVVYVYLKRIADHISLLSPNQP